MSSERGKIHSGNRARQLRDFSNIRIGNITPTDVDGLIEYNDEAFVFFELKVVGNEMPFGQDLALRRLCKAVSAGGKPAILFLAEHNHPVDKQIDAGNATVRKYYWHGMWWDYSGNQTLGELIHSFLRKHATLR